VDGSLWQLTSENEMKRYCLIIFTPSDDDAIMHPMPEGNYIKYEDYKAKIDLAISVLNNLKNVALHNTTAEELNTIASQAIEELKK